MTGRLRPELRLSRQALEDSSLMIPDPLGWDVCNSEPCKDGVVQVSVLRQQVCPCGQGWAGMPAQQKRQWDLPVGPATLGSGHHDVREPFPSHGWFLLLVGSGGS